LETGQLQTRKTVAVQVGLIGGGAFAQRTILPALAKLDQVRLKGVATAGGRSAHSLAEKYGASYATTSYEDILGDEEINLVVIATRHGLHASMVVEALKAGKDVFVEKPLALTIDELRAVAEACASSPGRLMVGFNRRFAPMITQIRDHFQNRSTPLMVHYRVNAGQVPAANWVHDPVEGGGRILGEVCHFVDLEHYLVGAPPQSVYATRLPAQGANVMGDDNVMATLEFADGSRGGVLYTALAADSIPKEFIEVMGDGKAATLDNYRSLSLYHGTRKKVTRSRQDKGHEAEFSALINSILQGEEAPIPLDDLLLSSLATLCIVESLSRGVPVPVDLARLTAGTDSRPIASSEEV
jgi:predicted dehydrogenase